MKTSSTAAYRENRAKFPSEELRKMDGQWVAFSADGQRIVASAATIAELSNQVHAVHEDLREVVLEHIEVESTDINLWPHVCISTISMLSFLLCMLSWQLTGVMLIAHWLFGPQWFGP